MAIVTRDLLPLCSHPMSQRLKTNWFSENCNMETPLALILSSADHLVDVAKRH